MIDDLLRPLAGLAQVTDGSARIAQAVRPVRFSTGLRRGWKEARVEASVRAIALDLRRDGAPVPDLRTQIVENGRPDEDRAQAIWLAHSDAVGAMADLNSTEVPRRGHSAAKVLSNLRRDVGLELVPPAPGVENDLIVALSESGEPALLRVAIMVGQWRGTDDCREAIVRDAYVRWFLTDCGLDPTGLALPDWDELDLDPYLQGTRAGMGEWISHVERAIVDSMSEALAISTSVLAGRTDTDYT